VLVGRIIKTLRWGQTGVCFPVLQNGSCRIPRASTCVSLWYSDEG
jgi:hypothetical protein